MRRKITRAKVPEDGNQMMVDRLNGNYLRLPYFAAFRHEHAKGLLPYPTREIRVGDDTCLMYDIPRAELQGVLDKIWAWWGQSRFVVGKSGVDPWTDGKRHRYSSAKVLYVNGYNYIVSPTFFKYGYGPNSWAIKYHFY